MWLEPDKTINHMYYKKQMRTKLLIPERSAMSNKQKINILIKEVIRRISNTNVEKVGEKEVSEVLNHLTRQLKNSGDLDIRNTGLEKKSKEEERRRQRILQRSKQYTRTEDEKETIGTDYLVQRERNYR